MPAIPWEALAADPATVARSDAVTTGTDRHVAAQMPTAIRRRLEWAEEEHQQLA